MAVELDLTEEEATVIWCEGAIAIKKAERALAAGDDRLATYYFGWLASAANQVAKAAPEELRPDGSETDKPGP